MAAKDPPQDGKNGKIARGNQGGHQGDGAYLGDARGAGGRGEIQDEKLDDLKIHHLQKTHVQSQTLYDHVSYHILVDIDHHRECETEKQGELLFVEKMLQVKSQLHYLIFYFI